MHKIMTGLLALVLTACATRPQIVVYRHIHHYRRGHAIAVERSAPPREATIIVPIPQDLPPPAPLIAPATPAPTAAPDKPSDFDSASQHPHIYRRPQVPENPEPKK